MCWVCWRGGHGFERMRCGWLSRPTGGPPQGIRIDPAGWGQPDAAGMLLGTADPQKTADGQRLQVGK
jgi:hypothetical protein